MKPLACAGAPIRLRADAQPARNAKRLEAVNMGLRIRWPRKAKEKDT